ncbi:overexpressed in colon carcinoma 1 protein isoform X1 [Betta splendens]|uniref:Overexpressed in colon carcinoma 1 protein isoform X1 n=1 Tax=Betta splendens TaxID=158456 RepID=A0A6P7MT03_BETSP|nr:overexpressed in colon carcinoma 1 protein isoform X1 [Betta splendens]
MRNGLWQFLSHQHLGRGASRNLQRCKILQQKMRKEGIMVVCMWVYQPTSPLWLLVKPSPHIKTSCYRRTHNADPPHSLTSLTSREPVSAPITSHGATSQALAERGCGRCLVHRVPQ